MKTIGSICAGIGGFDSAFQAARYETKWYCEIDPQCCKLLTEKFPQAKSYGDLTQFKPDPIADTVDAVCGGTPCQDLSVAGLRAGLDGKRSGLFYQMVRVCKRLRPRHIIWENVPGAFSSNRGRDFAAVLRAFTGLAVEVPAEGWGNAGFVRTPFPACRWHVAWRVLDAQYFGLAQRRERVFLVGSLGDASCLEILFEPESVCGNPAPSREAGQRTAGTISARTEGGGGLGTDFEIGGGGLSKTLKAAGNCKHREDSETYILTVSPPIAGVSNGGGGANGPGRTADDAESLIVRPTDELRGGGYVDDDKASTLKSRDSKDATDLVITHTLRGEGFDASEDGTGRGTPIITFRSKASFCETGIDIVNTMQTEEGGTPAIAFQPRYFTRDNKTGNAESCGDVTAALSSQHSSGDSAPHVAVGFYPTGGSHGVSAQDECSPAVKVGSGIGIPSGPAVAFTERTRADGRNFECQEEVAYALTNPGSGGRTHSRAVAHETGVRRLTPTECERLQGFPDGWTKGFSDSARYRMLGNAVAKPVAEWIARRIAKQ